MGKKNVAVGVKGTEAVVQEIPRGQPDGGTTYDAVPVADVLDSAKHCDIVLVLGLDPAGQLYAASSSGEKGTHLFLMECFKHNLIAGNYDRG